MKLSELLISIAIFSLVIVSSAFAVSSIMKSSRRIKDNQSESILILETDYTLREHIDSTEFIYWQDRNKVINDKIMSLKFLTLDGITINSVDEIYDQNNNTIGLSVKWKTIKDEYETKERF